MGETMNMENISSLGELVSRYGFLVIFGVIMLLIIIIVSVTLINRLSAMMKMKYDAEAHKMNIENMHLEKQREVEIDQQKKMFDLVTNVQTEQVSQLREISSIMGLMKQELQTDTASINRSNALIDELNRSITDITLKYDALLSTISNVDQKTNVIDEKLNEVVTLVNNVNELIDKLGRQKEEKENE